MTGRTAHKRKAGLADASIRGQVATGQRAGRSVQLLGDRIDPADMEDGTAHATCVAGGGFSLHAGVAVPAGDRTRLERLCRYVARPLVATARLTSLPDGRLLYRLKRRWRDGTTHMVFDPAELIEKLVSLVPPPSSHQVRYHGVLAPAAGWRAFVVPLPLEDSRTEAAPDPAGARRSGPPGNPRRLSWAELMRRVFAIDVLECPPPCGGRLRILAAIHDPDVVRAILDCLDLLSRAPPVSPARPDPEDDTLA